MKKVLAIIGSPRKGETYKSIQLFEQKLKQFGEIQFDYLFLRDFHLEQCKGCMACLFKGEEYCPLKDDRDIIFTKMLDADGIVFASPNYSLQVSALMKNLLDRLAFVFHRPCFFHKTSIALVTQGVYGKKDIISFLENVADFWGFKIAHGIGLDTPPGFQSPSLKKLNDKKLQKSAKNFYHLIKNEKSPQPSVKKLALFRFVRSLKHPSQADRDYEYFKEKGWLECDYYYKVKLNPIKILIGKFVDWAGHRLLKKMQKEQKKTSI